MTFLQSATTSAILLATLAGCSASDSKRALDQERSNLRWLLKLQTQMMSRTGQSPQNEEEFKAFIKSLDSAALERVFARANASNVDELFVSERDGQPYVFFYGQQPEGVAKDLIVYEQMGVGGKRYVGYGLGIVEEVDEAQFAELVPEAIRPEK